MEPVEFRRRLHAHPELSFKEHDTAAFIEQQLDELGIEHRRIASTGVVARIKGRKTPEGDRRAAVLRADIDALPVTERNDCEWRSQNEGVMHACGHDMHAAVLFGVLRKGGDSERALPAWCGWLAVVVGVIMGFVCAHSYYMPARPAWSNFTLYVYYYGSELVLGAAGAWLVAAVLKEDAKVGELLAKLTCAMGVVSAVAVVVAGFYWTTISFGDVGYSFHTTDPTAALPAPAAALAAPMSGSEAGMFWGGAVVVGSLVAAVCGALGWKKPQVALPASAAALVCSLIGGVCFRVVLYAVGVSFYVYF